MANDAAKNGLAGLRILCLESRRGQEMAKLISNYGGEAIVAPSMQEVTLKDNPEALNFARKLTEGGFDMVIFLTGVGTRALVRLVEAHDLRQKFVEALKRVKVVARGPKPVAALAELGVPVTVAVPEPNTWREVLGALDARAASMPLKGSRVAVQEYGATNPELLDGLKAARRERDARAGLRMGAAGGHGSAARRRASHRERAYRYGVLYDVGAGAASFADRCGDAGRGAAAARVRAHRGGVDRADDVGRAAAEWFAGGF